MESPAHPPCDVPCLIATPHGHPHSLPACMSPNGCDDGACLPVSEPTTTQASMEPESSTPKRRGVGREPAPWPMGGGGTVGPCSCPLGVLWCGGLGLIQCPTFHVVWVFKDKINWPTSLPSSTNRCCPPVCLCVTRVVNNSNVCDVFFDGFVMLMRIP